MNLINLALKIIEIQDTCDACDESEEISRNPNLLMMLFCVSALLVTKDDPQVQIFDPLCPNFVSFELFLN